MDRRVLWTSNQVAEALGVGVSSIKRWTDEGRLESTRTLGGHRRYSVEAVHRFAQSKGLPVDKLPRIETPPPDSQIEELSSLQIRNELLEALRDGDAALARQLIAYPISTLADRSAYLDRVLGESLRLIGEGWAEGSWSVDQEHRASYIIADVLDRMRPSAPSSPNGRRRAVLAAPPGELHDLPLRMVRLVLEWSGWMTDYYGADVPWGALEYAVSRRSPDLLVLSARTSAPFDGGDFEQVLRECQIRRIRVAIGGEWARGGVHRETGYTRFRTLRGFESWLRGLERGTFSWAAAEG